MPDAHPESAPTAGAEPDVREALRRVIFGAMLDEQGSGRVADAVLIAYPVLRTPAPPAEAQGLLEALEAVLAWDHAQVFHHKQDGIPTALLTQVEAAVSAPPRNAGAGGGVREVLVPFARTADGFSDRANMTASVYIEVRGAGSFGARLTLGDFFAARTALASTPPPGPAVEDAAGEAHIGLRDVVRLVQHMDPAADHLSRERKVDRKQVLGFLGLARLAEDRAELYGDAPHAPAAGAGVPADGAKGGLTADAVREEALRRYPRPESFGVRLGFHDGAEWAARRSPADGAGGAGLETLADKLHEAASCQPPFSTLMTEAGNVLDRLAARVRRGETAGRVEGE